MSFLLTNWRSLLLAGAVIVAFLSGWKVATWRAEAARAAYEASVADSLKRDLAETAERQRKLAIENSNIALRLAEAEWAADNDLRVILKKVPLYVPNDPTCTFSADFVRLRNQAAGYPVSTVGRSSGDAATDRGTGTGSPDEAAVGGAVPD